jgi:hypothetical protein
MADPQRSFGEANSAHSSRSTAFGGELHLVRRIFVCTTFPLPTKCSQTADRRRWDHADSGPTRGGTSGRSVLPCCGITLQREVVKDADDHSKSGQWQSLRIAQILFICHCNGTGANKSESCSSPTVLPTLLRLNYRILTDNKFKTLCHLNFLTIQTLLSQTLPDCDFVHMIGAYLHASFKRGKSSNQRHQCQQMT